VSSSLTIQLVSTTPGQIQINASPTTVAPSGTSTLTAVVRDTNDNAVYGQTVSFSLSDSTGGSLSAQSGVTDITGSASVTYHATTVTSGANGVVVTATVAGAGGSTITPPHPAYITVATQALFVTLGTGKTISTLNDTQYQMPYSVAVVDASNNPVPGATLNLSIASIAFQKGYYHFDSTVGQWVLTPTGTFTNGVYDGGYQIYSDDTYFNIASNPTFATYASTHPGFADFVKTPFGCVTEDLNLNGVIDPTGGFDGGTEDYNGDAVLEPGGVASVPSTVALDATTGSQQFFITYPKDHAQWVEVRLTAIAAVAGTESTAEAIFMLPVLASDVSDKGTEPPGQFSPYGYKSDSISDSCSSKS